MNSVNMIGMLLVLSVILQPCMAATDMTKAVVMDLSMDNGVVTLIRSYVVYNYPPDNLAHKNIIIQLKDEKGSLLEEQGIDDPRIAYLEDGVTYLDHVNFSVVVPYKKDLARVDLSNGTSRELLISVDTKNTLSAFCRDNSADPECGTSPRTTPGSASPVLVLTGGAAIVMAGMFYLKKKNQE